MSGPEISDFARKARTADAMPGPIPEAAMADKEPGPKALMQRVHILHTRTQELSGTRSILESVAYRLNGDCSTEPGVNPEAAGEDRVISIIMDFDLALEDLEKELTLISNAVSCLNDLI